MKKRARKRDTPGLAEEITEVLAQVVEISCDVCGEKMGFVEGSEAPAAICSDECIERRARQNINWR